LSLLVSRVNGKSYHLRDRFDEDNFVTSFKTACKYCTSPQEIVEYLFDQVEQFIGSERQNTDDMTLVVLQIV